MLDALWHRHSPCLRSKSMKYVATNRRMTGLTPQRLAGWPAVVSMVLLFSASVIIGQTADSLRVDQLVRDVIKSNNRVAASRYMEEAAQFRVGPAGAWDDPMLMLGVASLPTSFNFTMDPMTMKMVGLSQSIPYAGQKHLQSQAAKAEAGAALEDRYASEVDMAMAARFAFVDLYYRTKSQSDLASQYELLDQIVASAKGKLVTNQAGQDELLGAQAEQWRLQTQLLEAEHMVEESQYDLNILRGAEVTATIPPLAMPAQTDLPKDPDNWLVAAKANYPPLKKLSRQSESYSFSSAAARRMGWPMLNVQATYGFRAGSDVSMDGISTKRDNMLGFQANISLPFFSGHQQKKMALSMEAMRKSVDAEAIQKWREVEARVRLLHTTALHLVQTIDLYQNRIIPAARDAFQSALAGYSANRVPYTNLLMFANKIYGDRLSLNQFSNQLARTRAEIDSYILDPRSFTVETIGTSK
jgi:outer membrane protein, heavy metal efflux system